jgi:hypothetical protein
LASSLQRLDLVLDTEQLAIMSRVKYEFSGGNGHLYRLKLLSGRWYDDLLSVLGRASKITFVRRILAETDPGRQ